MSFNMLSAAHVLEVNVYILGQHQFACLNAHLTWSEQKPRAREFHA